MKEYRVNIDGWRLSFDQPQGTFRWLSQQFSEAADKCVDFGDWRLRMTNSEFITEEEAEAESPSEAEVLTEIEADVILADDTVLGHFHFTTSSKCKGLTFFTFNNKALYAFSGGGVIGMFGVVMQQLGLTLRTQTQIDIAVDVNFNLYLPIARHIKDFQRYDMILNGKRIEDENRTLEGVGEWFSRSRKKRERYPTLYFEHSRPDGLKLRVYDKTKEVEASGKNYILEHNGFGKAKTYRFEAVVKWAQFKRFIHHVKDVDTDCPADWKLRPNETDQEHFERTIHTLVCDDDYSLALWSWACDHVLYFRNKQTNERISMCDLLVRL